MTDDAPRAAVGAGHPISTLKNNDREFGAAGQPSHVFTQRPSSLGDLLKLLNPNCRDQSQLYPGGSQVTRAIRIGQLTSGWLGLLDHQLRREPCAIVTGPGLAYTNGWVTASDHGVWNKALSSSSHLQPFITVACAHHTFVEVFNSLGIDPASELTAYPHPNGHLVFRGFRGGLPCIVHYGRSAQSRITVMRHARGLQAARERLSGIFPGLLPEVFALIDAPDSVVFAEQKLFGMAPSISSLSQAELERMTRAALEPPYTIYERFWRRSKQAASKAIFSDLLALLEVLPEYKAHIAPSLDALRRWSNLDHLTGLPSHGDYAPRNILYSDDRSRIVGIYDWEWFWDNGVVGFDALQMALEMHAEWKRKSPIIVLADFLRGQDGDAAPSGVHVVGEMFGLSPSDLWHIALLMWLRFLWIGCVMTDPSTPEWLEQAVMLPAQAVAASGRVGIV